MRDHRVVVTSPGQVELEWLDPPRPQRGQVLLRARNHGRIAAPDIGRQNANTPCVSTYWRADAFRRRR